MTISNAGSTTVALRLCAAAVLTVAIAGQVSAQAASSPSGQVLEGELTIVPIDLDIPLKPEDPMPGVPGQSVSRGAMHIFFASKDGAMQAGVWEGTPGTVDISGYPVDEVWRVVSGSITFTNGRGVSQSFAQGASFVVPRGFRGKAVMTETFRKVFVSFASRN